jgi:outer membrane protein
MILACLFNKTASAQEGANIYQFQYTMGFSTGDFNDFISKGSFRGGTFEYHHLFTDNIAAGFEIGWNAWYEEMNYATYTKGTESISGKQFRYCSTVPMMASFRYHILPGEEFNPFAGIGIGTMFSDSELDMGTWAFTTETWHFALDPEIGAVYKFPGGVGALVSAKYYLAFETEESKERSYIAANVGFVWGF